MEDRDVDGRGDDRNVEEEEAAKRASVVGEVAGARAGAAPNPRVT